jgi:hypothetical protein
MPSVPTAGGDRTGDDADAGLGAPVTRATDLLSGVLAILDPARLTGPDAAELYRMFAAVERLSMAGKTLLAPRIDESGVWRDGGHRSPAVMLAELEGVPTGRARNTLDVGRRLPELPGTEEALRSGSLSGPKVDELSGAAVLDPGSEGALLAGAAEQPLQKIRERCQRARSTAEQNDPIAAVRRIHAARHFTSWTDGEGAFCFQGKDTADRGARILEQMQHTVARIRAARKSAGSGRSPATGPTAEGQPVESDAVLRADAFFLLVTGRSPARSGTDQVSHVPPGTGSGHRSPEWRGSDSDPGDDDPGPAPGHISTEFDSGIPPGAGSPATRGVSGSDPPAPASSGPGAVTGFPDGNDIIDRPPTCSVMVRVDLDALLRGHALPGEVCEIDNQGPIPVATARDLANDSFLRLVFHRVGDIRAVSHFGRTINRHLRTALAYRDRCCVVPGCGVPFGLEIDHVIPFAEGGPTELDNLALLCHHHHYIKTYEGWTLERQGGGDDGSPTWTFTPLPPFGQEPDPGPRQE